MDLLIDSMRTSDNTFSGIARSLVPYYKDIKEYVEDPNYAGERDMLSQYQEFGWQHGFDSFEDFLMEKAERIKEMALYDLDSDYEAYK